MNLASALNTVWMWKCRGEAQAFQRATRAVARTQALVLAEIVARNRHTAFGAGHGFDGIRSPRDFQERVPLSNYDAHADFITRAAAGEPNVLTRDRVLLFEPTSGSTRGEKLIPYTQSLRSQFQRAVSAWIADLMHHRPAVRRGRAYWSISPSFGPSRRTAGGIRIGFDDDTAYLGLLERFAARRLLVVPPEIARVGDIENFRYCTLLHLLQAEDLALISIWSPTFLNALLEPLQGWGERICFDLRRGRLSLPVAATSPIPEKLHPQAAHRRARQLEQILRSGRSVPEKLREIWPRLALISCWTDASAAQYVPQIQGLFPDVEIQPKGLLATEGCVSIPLVGLAGAALALRSHFFEFEEIDEHGTDRRNYRLAHELTQGAEYRVILTTGGGLYRYPLQDIVKVAGFCNECPLLKFQGKSDCVSDLVGEKLSEPHVRGVLERCFAHHGIRSRFAMVVPVAGWPPRYRLYLQAEECGPEEREVFALASSLQTGLEENPYYAHAIRLHQLARLEVCLLHPASVPGWLVYERRCLSRGQKAGDIKPTALDSWIAWPSEFERIDS